MAKTASVRADSPDLIRMLIWLSLGNFVCRAQLSGFFEIAPLAWIGPPLHSAPGGEDEADFARGRRISGAMTHALRRAAGWVPLRQSIWRRRPALARSSAIMPPSESIVASRRTFAIISHPDAGKTTLTEKLLLFGGAIQQAGMVKARGDSRRVRSDWMAVERERGISVSSAVMTFEYDDKNFNLLAN